MRGTYTNVFVVTFILPSADSILGYNWRCTDPCFLGSHLIPMRGVGYLLALILELLFS